MCTPTGSSNLDNLFRELVDNASEGVLLGAPDGRIFYANPAACRMFDCSLERFQRVGRAGIRNPDDPLWQERLDERTRTGTTTGMVRTFRLNGRPLLIEVSSSTFVGPDGEELTCTFLRDVSRRVRMERLLEAYDQMAEALLGGSAPADVLAMMARHACVVFDTACAAITVPAADGQGVDIVAAHGPAESDTFTLTFPTGGLADEVMTSRQPILAEDLGALSGRPEVEAMNVGPGMVVPIISEDRAIGALTLTPHPGHPGYTSEDLELATSYSAKAGVTLAVGAARAEAERQLRLNSERLQEALQTRIVIEQAKGLLAGVHSITPDEAFERLRRYARSHRADIHFVAQQVIDRRLVL